MTGQGDFVAQFQRKKWVNKTNSFKEAENFDRDYYFKMTAEERLETMQLLREKYSKIETRYNHENRKRLRRVFAKTKQAFTITISPCFLTLCVFVSLR